MKRLCRQNTNLINRKLFMSQQIRLNATVADSQLGQRLDQALAELFPDYSRSRIKEWILDNRVQVNDKIINKPKEKMLGGEKIEVDALIEEEVRWEPQNIPLNIVYEDDDILVINKPRRSRCTSRCW